MFASIDMVVEVVLVVDDSEQLRFGNGRVARAAIKPITAI